MLLSLWLATCGLLSAALLGFLPLIPCRLCGGAGWLALDAQPPGEPEFRVDMDCVACGGVGRHALLKSRD